MHAIEALSLEPMHVYDILHRYVPHAGFHNDNDPNDPMVYPNKTYTNHGNYTTYEDSDWKVQQRLL